MKFELLPILHLIKELYELPRDRRRFDEYLQKLQTETGSDMALPIGGYNPMAKESVLAQVERLMALDAEAIVEEELFKINRSLALEKNETFQVSLVLADDLGGAWSHHGMVDFNSKFKIKPLVKRQFCTPYLWPSEEHTTSLIEQRTREYVHRTIYWVENGAPIALEEYLRQEIYVAKQLKASIDLSEKRKEYLLQFVERNRLSEEYSLLFNFFYGDETSVELGYKKYGFHEMEGFELATYLAANDEVLYESDQKER